MHLTLVAFNYQSADLEAEELNYLGHHVQLARRFPGLRQYYTGRLMKVAGKEPDRVRAAIMSFDDARSGRIGDAIRRRAGAACRYAGASEGRNFDRGRGRDDRAVRFASAGQKCFVMVAEFNLEQSAGLDAAEKRYLGTHASIARRLPGLRNYVIGKLIKTPGFRTRATGSRYWRSTRSTRSRRVCVRGRARVAQGRTGHDSRRARLPARCASRSLSIARATRDAAADPPEY